MTLNSSIRRAALALAAACGVTAVPIAQAAGTVSSDVGGSQATLCSNYQGVTMSPAGDLQINGCVAASSSGGPTAAPACTVTANPTSVSTNGTSTISASCTQGPITGYSWTIGNNGPVISGASQTLQFPTNGSFTYAVQASNSAFGMGSVSSPATVTVSTPSSGGTPAGCPTYSQSVPMPVIGAQQQVSIAYNGQLAGLMPNMAQDGLTHTITVSPVQVVGQSTKLTVQLVISKCPGDFPNVITACSKWGTVYQGAMSISAYYMPAVPNPPSLSACQMEEGTQYYLNMRFIGYDSTNKVLTGSSYGCTSGTCMMWITGRIVN